VANRYLITVGGTYEGEASDIWHSESNQAEGDEGGFTEAADVARLDAFSGTLTLGAAMACVGLNGVDFSGAIALGANALDVNGDLALYGATITGSGGISVSGSIAFGHVSGDLSGWTGALTHDGTSGTPTLLTNAVAIPVLIVNNDGVDSFTLSDNLTVGDLTFTAGAFTTTGRTVTLIVSATAHDIDWDTTTYPIVHLLIPNGAKANLAGDTHINEFTAGTGAGGVCLTTDATKKLFVRIEGDDAWHQPAGSGTISPRNLTLAVNGDWEVDRFDGSAVDNAVYVEHFGDAVDRTLTMTDDWTAGAKALHLRSASNEKKVTLDTNGHGLTAGAITLGHTSAVDRSGVLDLATGSHSLASVVSGNAASLHNALDFAACALALSGTLNGDNIACSNTGATITGGVVQNVDVTDTVPVLRILPGADGTNIGVICPSWRRRIRKAQMAA